MQARPATRRTQRNWLMWGCLGAVALAGLSGCVSSGSTTVSGSGSTSVARQEFNSPSDDSDVRRRARIRLELAVSYFQQGQTNVALDEVKQSLNTDPSFGEAYNLRGLIYMRMNDLRLAEEDFRKALSLGPGNANVMHNHGWLMCQERRFGEADAQFVKALAVPSYPDRAKTLMAQGLCKARAGQRAEAEALLLRSYELDPASPVTGYNLAVLLFERGDLVRAQFYIRRLNNTDLANADSLWLGIRVERRIGDKVAMQQLVDQLRKRFPQSRELVAYERGAFDE